MKLNQMMKTKKKSKYLKITHLNNIPKTQKIKIKTKNHYKNH